MKALCTPTTGTILKFDIVLVKTYLCLAAEAAWTWGKGWKSFHFWIYPSVTNNNNDLNNIFCFCHFVTADDQMILKFDTVLIKTTVSNKFCVQLKTIYINLKSCKFFLFADKTR